ncbi:MAG: phosphate signaling complex protein PhoU [Candidatus Methanomethylophilaceae archaeon]|jgi:phosphate transport system protein|nr:phosphate signaling complex protein PhoU [Candidatus Methanomethylophilaceae archaeon]MDD2779625.1 phosphate signaling complex protein PhoU [Candidatus Methanomethylophilaceae archaeon]MDD4119555.1 phosphate signaling complex protein PhoU [Candidatus Methanomethylophilaceae archaeon]
MKRFIEDLNNLVGTTNGFGNLVLSMAERSVYALNNLDAEVAKSVMDDYAQVDYLDGLIEEEALRILMLFQPMVSDMRMVAVILKTITYMERIGKYCYNVAKAVIYLSDAGVKRSYKNISAMGELAVDMIRMVTETMKDRDITRFEEISAKDQKMDELRDLVLNKSVEYMSRDPCCVDVCTYFISISKFFERIGDHACKSAEKITYMVNGKRVNYN